MRGILLGALLLSGCAYKLKVESVPNGALVELPTGETIGTPDTAKFKWTPFFGRQLVRVTAPGYRTIEVDLRDREITMWTVIGQRIIQPWTIGASQHGRVEFVLVPDHGPSGTWDPEAEGLAD